MVNAILDTFCFSKGFYSFNLEVFKSIWFSLVVQNNINIFLYFFMRISWSFLFQITLNAQLDQSTEGLEVTFVESPES